MQGLYPTSSTQPPDLLTGPHEAMFCLGFGAFEKEGHPFHMISFVPD